MKSTVDYGIYAPNAIVKCLALGGIGITVSHFAPGLNEFARDAVVWAGLISSTWAFLLIGYSRFGKFRHRDRILRLIRWRDDEVVLDVGTKWGLLAIGAAKKTPRGTVVALDTWNPEDRQAAKKIASNSAIEGVTDRMVIREEKSETLPFAAESFDVVVSNLSLHHLDSSDKRRRACVEIARVLKTGGRALISDFIKTSEYARYFRELGLEVNVRGPYFVYILFFKIVDVRKVN